MTTRNACILFSSILFFSCQSPRPHGEVHSEALPTPVTAVAEGVFYLDFSKMQVMQLPPPPPYPPIARLAKITGDVIVHFTINKQGNVTSVRALSGPPQLQPASEEYVSKVIFKRVIINGDPQFARSEMLVKWNLR